MSTDAVVLGGAAIALALLLGRGKDPTIVAAEGETAKGKVSPLEIVEEGKNAFGVGVSTVSETIKAVVPSKASASSGLAAFATDPIVSNDYVLSVTGLVRSADNPGLTFQQKVEGSGFTWDKSGRYAYNQAIKAEERIQKAESAGFDNWEEYSAYQDARHAAKRVSPEIIAAMVNSKGGSESPQTTVYSEEYLAANPSVAAVFEKQLAATKTSEQIAVETQNLEASEGGITTGGKVSLGWRISNALRFE